MKLEVLESFVTTVLNQFNLLIYFFLPKGIKTRECESNDKRATNIRKLAMITFLHQTFPLKPLLNHYSPKLYFLLSPEILAHLLANFHCQYISERECTIWQFVKL